MFGGGGDGVGVGAGGVREPDGRVVELAGQGGGAGGVFVAGEDALQEVGGGGGQDRVRGDAGVRVSVADHGQVGVVGVPAAGEHCVQLLAGEVVAGEAVHGVHGHALGGVDGARVPEFDGVAGVVGGQGDREPVAGVLDA